MTTPTLWIGINASEAGGGQEADMAKKAMAVDGRTLPIAGLKGSGLTVVREGGEKLGYGLVIVRNLTQPYAMDSARLESIRADVKAALTGYGITGPVNINIQPVDEHYTVH